MIYRRPPGRRWVNEDAAGRGGPEDGLRGERKQAQARFGFMKIGDEPEFVSKEFPKWEAPPHQQHRPA